MKPFLFVLALGLAHILAPTTAAQTITIAPQFKAGQKMTLELKQRREDNRAKQAPVSSTTLIELSVLQADSTGFLVDWVPGKTNFENPAQASNPIVQMVSASLKDLHMELVLNSLGEFQGFRNEAEVEARLKRAVDLMVEKVAETIPQDRKEQFLQAMNRLLSPRVLLSSARKDIDLYFSLYGVELEEGKPFEGTVDTPNPLGSGSLQSEIRIVLEQIDKEKCELRLVLEQRYDPSVFRDVMRQMLGQMGVQTPNPETFPPGTLTDTAVFRFNVAQGYMQHIRHERTIAVEQIKRVDRTEISVLKVE